MGRTYDLLVRARGDTVGAQAAMKDLQKSVRATGKHMTSIGKGMTMGLTLPVMALAALGAEKFKTLQAANLQTAAVLKSTGGVAHITAKHVTELSESLGNLAGVAPETVQASENVLLTFTKIGKKGGVFDQATTAALDMSTALHTDLKGASIQVGKALNDPIKGVTALRRVGVSFSQAQIDLIKKLEATHHHLRAQKLILRELHTEFSGSAAAAGKTFTAQLTRMKEQLAQIGMQLITVALPSVKEFMGWIEKGIKYFQALSPHTRKLIVEGALLAAALGPVLMVLGSIVTASEALIPILVACTGPVGLIAIAAIAAGAGLYYLYTHSETARSALNTLFTILEHLQPLYYLAKAADAVAQHFGGWKRTFLLVEKGYLSFISTVLGGLASMLNAMAHVPGMTDGMKKSLHNAADGMGRDAAKLSLRIAGINAELDGVGNTAPKTQAAFAKAVAPMMAKADSFAQSIRIAKREWENWSPAPKVLSVRAQLVNSGAAGRNFDGTTDGDGNPFTGKGRSVGNKNGAHDSGINFMGGFFGTNAPSLSDLIGYAGQDAAPSASFLAGRIKMERAYLAKLRAKWIRLPAIQAKVARLTALLIKLHKQYNHMPGGKKFASRKHALKVRISDVAAALKAANLELADAGGSRSELADAMLQMAAQIVNDQSSLAGLNDQTGSDPSGSGIGSSGTGGSGSGGTLDALFQAFESVGSDRGVSSISGTVTAQPGQSGSVVIQQYFTGSPDMFAASQSAMFQFQTAGFA